MSKITRVLAREILDSRGNPTVQADVFSEHGFGRASAPSGASTGTHEAHELRDGGKRYGGKGVKSAVANVNGAIAKHLAGLEVSGQHAIDSALIRLDGTSSKSKLGANATTAVSLAAAQCAAKERGVGLYSLMGGRMLPAPMLNVLNGGKHAAGALAMQELMIFPLYFPSFSEALQAGTEIYHALGSLLAKKYGSQTKLLGDEGGFAPPLRSTSQALDLLESAIRGCGYGKKVKIAIDAAASSFYDKRTGRYSIDGKKLSASQLTDFYSSLVKSYPIVSLEDPFEEESFGEFAALRKRLAGKVQLVGDDLLVTNVSRIKTAVRQNSVSALLLKVNQIGTLSESLDAARLCRGKGLGVIVSHRSGETEDATIADVAVGLNCGQIKTGAPARAERTAKYNRLLQIEEELGSGHYAGASGLVF